MPRVLVAMSGGVDSSVAAALLVEQGFDVVGATMKLFCHDGDLPDRPCCSLDSVNDARRVCERLGIPHYVLNMEQAFGRDVVGDFVAEYARGRTPIPCVRCNTFTKFRDLVGKADSIDADFVATGHYARVDDGRLYRGLDPSKDQSYFLWGLRREILARLILPVGALTKAETRRRAAELGLDHVAAKAESQDICFVPDGDHAKVIAARLGPGAESLRPGPILMVDGRQVGVHEGFARYTIGQRRGLPGGFPQPMFVVRIDPDSRSIVIGSRDDLRSRSVTASEVNWLGPAVDAGDRVLAQIRHRSDATEATILEVGTGSLSLTFDWPVSAVTPGQSVVLYRGGLVLGGGIIETGGTSRRELPVTAA